MEATEIIPGKAVFHRANPGRLGVLTGNRLAAMFVMAEVDWGNQIEFVDVSQLVVRELNAVSSTDSDVKNARYGTIEDLRRRITFEKLRGMLTDVFYSMKTSEIDFYPHQFKPVLRFIESATNRLLIADEVGLGKTIEAGLIWTEWQARERARRLLVVCPPTLVPKWLRELQDRFQLAAEATDASQLLELVKRFERKGPGISFVLVTSYHALRPFRRDRALLEQLKEDDAQLDAKDSRLSAKTELLHRVRVQGEEAAQTGTHPFLDMVVFDEAHTMKNTASSSYLAGEILSGAAAAAVCLSATPIHNASRDLYSLLRLIDPEVFRDEHVFELLRMQNYPIVRLQNLLSSTNWTPDDVKSLIPLLPTPQAITNMSAALESYDGSARTRVEIRHLAEKQNLLSNFINRTRKRDVIDNRVIRMPVTFQVRLSPEERNFYTTVLNLVRRDVRRRGESVTSFHLIHPALRMSSSLPVVAESVATGKWGGFEEIEQIAEDLSVEIDSESEIPAFNPEEIRKLGSYDFERGDTKYAALLQALHSISNNKLLVSDKGQKIPISPKEKIIIFAFFKQTIAYLKRRLEADGFSSISVTGDIKDRKERDNLFLEFAKDDNRILLCSEIGAEGVDLQFARVVVNYDLPWNPMRVEQRIGRIDRIGQESENIIIINFNVLDTIDGSIFAHLYNKIGIFEQSVGALEGILGEEVAKFTSTVFREDLTMEQVSLRAEQTADAVCNRAHLESELEESTGALLAFQDLLSERIGESQRLGRFIKPHELHLHTLDFFADRYKDADACVIIPDNPVPDALEIKLSFRAFTDFEQYCLRQDQQLPVGFSPNTRTVQLTFDPLVHQYHRRNHFRLVLITHLHTFFRWITKENESVNNRWHKVSAVRVRNTKFAQGRYFYLIYRMTLEGITRRDAFHYSVKDIGTGRVVVGNEAESMLNTALEDADSLFPRSTPDYTPHLAELRSALAEELRSAQRLFRQDQDQKLDIRRQQLNAHFDRLIQDQLRRISTFEQKGAERPRLAGFRKRLANLKEKQAEQLGKLNLKASSITESFAEVACGFMEVER